MAKGRLGKAKIASKATAAVYTNSSGNEASITIKAQSTAGTTFNLVLDDSSTALTQSTTVVSETYNERYLKYYITNPLVTDPASVYVGRFSYFDTTGTTGTSNLSTMFEAYVAGSSTTYTFSTQDLLFPGSMHIWPYQTWKNVHSEATRMLMFGNESNMNNVYMFNEGPSAVTEDVYYDRIINGENTGANASYGIDYHTSGIVFDPWAADPQISIGIASNSYMSARIIQSGDSSFGQGNRTSDSVYYNQIGSSNTQPSSDFPRRRLYLQNNACVMDGLDNTSTSILNFFGTDFETSSSADTRADAMVSTYTARGFYFNNNVSRRGGNTVFFEYNPADGLHYWCYYRNSNTTYYLATIDRSTFIDTVSGGNIYNLATDSGVGGKDYESYGLVHTDISLTVASPFDFSTSTNNTSRCTFIGTLEKPLWALVFSRYVDNTAAHVYYSTDLKTWQRSSDYFSPSDYSELVSDTTVASNSGVVTAVKSNISNIGVDGVLENNTNFGHYENTGLVISNGDRVVVYNSGQNECVVQVMGYEGE